VRSIRAQEPKAIVLAVPVAAPETIVELEPEVDRIVCLHMPVNLYAIGLWYADFRQVSDDEVTSVLERARRERAATERAVALTSGILDRGAVGLALHPQKALTRQEPSGFARGRRRAS
jgi:hypothetical protein